MTEKQCNCDQAQAAERRATIALESLAAIKRTLQSDMGPDQKLNWIGSIAQLALANAERVAK